MAKTRCASSTVAVRGDIKIVGEDLHPLAQLKDFAPYVAKVKAAHADAIVTGNWGNDLALLVKAAKESDLKIEISWPDAQDGPPRDVQWFPADNDPLIIKDIKVTPFAAAARVNARVELSAGQKLSRNTIESVLGYTDGQGRRRGLSLSVPIQPPTGVDKGKR
jgi:hypothetical protein